MRIVDLQPAANGLLKIVAEDGRVGLAQLHRDDLQPLRLETGEDVPDKAAFDGIRLQKDEGTVRHSINSTAKP